MLAGTCGGLPYNKTNIKCNRTQFPNNVVQPMGTYGEQTQGTYIKKKSTNSTHCNSFQCDAGTKCCKPTPQCSNPGTYFIGGKKFTQERYFKNTNVLGGNEYTKTLYMKKQKFPTSSASTAFPSNINHNRRGGVCDVNYNLLAEAQAAGWPWNSSSTVNYASSSDASKLNPICAKKKCAFNIICSC